MLAGLAALTFEPVGKTYGERFKELRLQRAGDDDAKVVAIARRIGKGYPSTVYNIERQWRLPSLKTLARHADALGCKPWDLLVGVSTEYDRVRDLAGLPERVADAKWNEILKKYGAGAKRGERARASKGRNTA